MLEQSMYNMLSYFGMGLFGSFFHCVHDCACKCMMHLKCVFCVLKDSNAYPSEDMPEDDYDTICSAMRSSKTKSVPQWKLARQI